VSIGEYVNVWTNESGLLHSVERKRCSNVRSARTPSLMLLLGFPTLMVMVYVLDL
jgi:hypothetical protein